MTSTAFAKATDVARADNDKFEKFHGYVDDRFNKLQAALTELQEECRIPAADRLKIKHVRQASPFSSLEGAINVIGPDSRILGRAGYYYERRVGDIFVYHEDLRPDEAEIKGRSMMKNVPGNDKHDMLFTTLSAALEAIVSKVGPSELQKVAGRVPKGGIGEPRV
jgi:hypothetical protein